MTAISGHVCLELYKKQYLIQFYPFPNDGFKTVYNNIGYSDDILPPFKSYPNETRRNLIIKMTDVSNIVDYFYLTPKLGKPNELNKCLNENNNKTLCICNDECVVCEDKKFGLPVEVEKNMVHVNKNCEKEPYSNMIFSDYKHFDRLFRDININQSEIHMNNYFPKFCYELNNTKDSIELTIQLKDDYALISNTFMLNFTFHLKIFFTCNENETRTQTFNLVFEETIFKINKTLKFNNLSKGYYFIELIPNINTTICESNYCPFKRTGSDNIDCEPCGKQLVYLNAFFNTRNNFKQDCLKLKDFINFNNLFDLNRKYKLTTQNELFLVNTQFQFITFNQFINGFDISCSYLPKLKQIKSHFNEESHLIRVNQSHFTLILASSICGLVAICVICLILIAKNNKKPNIKFQSDFYVFYPSIYASIETNSEVIQYIDKKLKEFKVNISFLRDDIFLRFSI